jgi:hypothetical protein
MAAVQSLSIASLAFQASERSVNNPTDFSPIGHASVRGHGRFLLAAQRGNFPRTFGANA